MPVSTTTPDAITLKLEVTIPLELADAFADAMTGHDDDVILAAETAIRERIDGMSANPSVEIWTDHRDRGTIRELARSARIG